MRVIKSIELENFKSFGNITKITFLEGLNVIIGPNGSGKSNISDAICFALGRGSKKELRTERFSQFIFNGGKRGKPADYAKVTVVLNNEKRNFPIDSDEIIIVRKVDKDGRTSYRVNGERQTIDYVKSILKQGGLDPDGYNIILQGSIQRITDMSAKERRNLIESIAGISFYEDRKHKSELELNKVEERLREVRIMLAEKAKYMKELEDEKKHAERYIELQTKLKYKQKALLIKKIKEQEKVLEELEKQIEEIQKQIENDSSEIESKQKQIEELEKQIEEINKKIEEMGGKKQIEIANKITELKNKISNYEFIIENDKKEIERIMNRRKELIEEKQSIKEEIESKQKQIEELENQLKEYEEKLSQAESQFKEKQELKKNLEKMKSRLSEIEISIAKNKMLLEKMEELKKEQVKRKEIEKELESLPKGYDDEIANLNSKLNELRNELNSLIEKRARTLSAIEHSTERVNRAMNVLKKELKGVIGTVYDLCKVKDYHEAIDAVAGRRWEYIVVEDVNTAKKAIEIVKKHRLGIFTFIPLNKIEKFNALPNSIVNYLEFDERYSNLFNMLFGDIILVENLDEAKDKIGKFKMVTKAGEVIEKKYLITGGYRIGRHEVEKLNEKIDSLKREIISLESHLDELKQRNYEITSKRIELKSKLEMIPKFDENSYELLKDAIKNLEKEKEELIEKVNSVKIENYEEEQKIYEELKSKRDSIKLEVISLKRELENILLRDLKRVDDVLKELDKEQKRFQDEIEKITNELKKLKKQLEELEAEEVGFRKELKELYERRDKLFEEVKETEKKIIELEGEIKNLEERKNNISVEKARVLSVITGLKEEAKEIDIEVSEVKESINKLEEEIKELKEKIANYGPVNMRALEVFKEVEKEYNDLKERFEKVIEEKEEILRTIDELEEKKKQVFLETLEKVSEAFNRIYSRLTKGGEAKLTIDETEPMESGVEIKVKIPGKKIMSIRSLSGGEKSLVSLALILALQSLRESIFYFLDEVDAALDKENSENLAELLKEYSKKAQLIVISHNDALMLAADTLYGVSMDKYGVSKVVSLKLPQ